MFNLHVLLQLSSTMTPAWHGGHWKIELRPTSDAKKVQQLQQPELDASKKEQADDTKPQLDDFFRNDFYKQLVWPVELCPVPVNPTSLYDFTDEQHNWAAAQFAKAGEVFLESF